MPPEEQTVETLTAALTAANAKVATLTAADSEAKAAKAELLAAQAALDKVNADIETTRAEAKAAREKAEKDVADTRTEAQKRVTEAELKAAAVAAGAKDWKDVLALVDRAALKHGADGALENGDALIASLKETKPYLFGGAASSHQKTPVPPKEPGLKPAKDLTDDEWAAKRKELGLR